MAAQQIIPWSWYNMSNYSFACLVLLAPVVVLLLFVKIKLQGKTQVDDETEELCKVTYLKMCVDGFAFLWISHSYNGLMVLLYKR